MFNVINHLRRATESALRTTTLCAGVLLIGACAAREEPPMMDGLAEIQGRMSLLEAELAATRQALSERRRRQASDSEALDDRLQGIDERLQALPEQLAGLCPQPSPEPASCEGGGQVQRVVVSGDRLVVGDEERVWVEPPAAVLVAGIDAAADSSSLYATDLVEFERDGKDWLRFSLPEQEEPVERPIERRLRVTQGGESNGSRRPVVALRVRLGDVRETVEFVVREADDPAHPLTLGRNFLTDLALLDVGKKNVQPTPQPPAD